MNIDITKGIEEGNNSRDLFNGSFENFNFEFSSKFDASDQVQKKQVRTLPPLSEGNDVSVKITDNSV